MTAVTTTPEAPRVSSQDKLLALVQRTYPNYHPVLALATLAHVSEDETVQFNCHKVVAQYVVQVDRFVEVKSEVKQTRRVVVELFGAEQQPALKQIDGTEVLDAPTVSTAPVGRSIVDTYETTTVRSSGSSEDDGDKHKAMLRLWGGDGLAKAFT